MINHYDIAYALGLAISAPVWMVIPKTRAKVIKALRQRVGEVSKREGSHRAVMIHAVSNGELNATTSLINLLRKADPSLRFIVSTTTESGTDQAQKLYGGAADVQLVRFPLDFSGAVNKLLDRTRPQVVALMEGDVWPNFVRRCSQRGIPVIVANGRMSAGSYRHYKWAKPFVGPTFQRLARVCAQDDEYARRFISVGADPQKVMVAGMMKFDSAEVAGRIEGHRELADAVGLHPGSESIWVCGSTGPGEEAIVLRIYRELLASFPKLRLVIVPRHKPRWDEVANLITAAEFRCIRRSMAVKDEGGLLPAVVLGDSFGELRKFYSLADVVFVGRSLVDLGSKQHGSDMIEAAALRKPVATGPWTNNFADAMRKFRAADAVAVVENESELRERISSWLTNPTEATAIAARAQNAVRREQGATERHAKVIFDLLNSKLNHEATKSTKTFPSHAP